MNYRLLLNHFLIALVIVYGGYNFGRSFLGPKQAEDFAQYYVAGKMVTENQAALIYGAEEAYQQKAKEYGVKGILIDGNTQNVMGFAYPPFVAVFMIPFTLLPYDIARYVFYFISVLATILSIKVLFADRPKERFNEMFKIGMVAAFLFFPNYYSFYMGQINSLLFLFCALGLYFIRKNNVWLSSLFIALASVIKFFPAIIILFFIRKKEYRQVAITIIFIFIFLVLSLIFTDINVYSLYFNKELPMQFSAGAYYRNQGFTGLFDRFFTVNEYVSPIINNPEFSKWLNRIAVSVILFITVLFTTAKNKRGSILYDIEYGFFFVAALLVLSKSWDHYGMFLLFSYLFILEKSLYGKDDTKMIFFISLSFCVWSFILTMGTEYQQLPKAWIINFIISAKFFATLLLYICSFYIIWKEKKLPLNISNTFQSL